jgi:3-phenylpropionate/trans-cinnamate dioxygenase ferredoxin reductase component
MRPPLSKAFLAREIGKDALIYKASVAYENARVEMRFASQRSTGARRRS